MTTTHLPAAPPSTQATSRRLVAAVVLLVAVDVGGGLLAVASGANTWGEAWGGAALLAAPAPMIAAQVVLTATAVLRRGRLAVGAGVLLGLACAVSVVSGFFDGGLGNHELSGVLVGYQVFLLAVTALVGVLACARARAARVRPVGG